MTELLTDAHFWVGVAFVIFLGLMVFLGVHKLAWNALGESGRKVQAQLDEAAALRAEAQALLENIKVERAAAESQVTLAETIERRGQMAERKNAQAEAQAEADVRAAAADLATQMAEQVLSQRLAGAKSDPLIDKALGQLAGKLQ